MLSVQWELWVWLKGTGREGGKAFYFYDNVAINILKGPKMKIFSYAQVIYFGN